MTAKPRAPKIVKLKVALVGIRPPIWRRVLVPDSMTLADLHEVIQAAMGWVGGHLHAFDVAGDQYGNPKVLDDVRDECRLTVRQVAAGGVVRFRYTYDFGDDWEHVIAIEGVEPMVEDRRYPACIAGKRQEPPEDCGGVWGYAELLEALPDPAHPSHEEAVETLGEDYDPQDFDVAEADARVAALCGAAGSTGATACR